MSAAAASAEGGLRDVIKAMVGATVTKTEGGGGSGQDRGGEGEGEGGSGGSAETTLGVGAAEDVKAAVVAVLARRQVVRGGVRGGGGGGGVSSASYASSTAPWRPSSTAPGGGLEQRTQQAGERDYVKLRELKRWREEGERLAAEKRAREEAVWRAVKEAEAAAASGDMERLAAAIGVAEALDVKRNLKQARGTLEELERAAVDDKVRELIAAEAAAAAAEDYDLAEGLAKKRKTLPRRRERAGLSCAWRMPWRRTTARRWRRPSPRRSGKTRPPRRWWRRRRKDWKDLKDLKDRRKKKKEEEKEEEWASA